MIESQSSVLEQKFYFYPFFMDVLMKFNAPPFQDFFPPKIRIFSV